MNPISERQLRSALRGAAAEVDLGDATARLLDRAEDEGLVEVAYATADSPFGRLLLAATDRGIVKVGLPNQDVDEVLSRLAAEVSPRVLEAPRRLDRARRELDDYFEGKLTAFDLPVDWRLSRGFADKVLHAVARIPYGETLSYGEVAAQAGNPRAFRAAGTACGINPVPLIVPCHRVIQVGGKPGNYGGGPEMKRALLELEGSLRA
ncbi:MAG TPA: methylated-DNA--[protein]-cysteine S-methyltransferase [Solirubrobacterales bacterium]|jgi:methylated-DNA-[protein]-cysteine S-methyltransferase|nr:methylated-DNA--[protein]-cysteine S-methyltransferase [Solirubrobacterales bacterium]